MENEMKIENLITAELIKVLLSSAPGYARFCVFVRTCCLVLTKFPVGLNFIKRFDIVVNSKDKVNYYFKHGLKKRHHTR